MIVGTGEFCLEDHRFVRVGDKAVGLSVSAGSRDRGERENAWCLLRNLNLLVVNDRAGATTRRDRRDGGKDARAGSNTAESLLVVRSRRHILILHDVRATRLRAEAHRVPIDRTLSCVVAIDLARQTEIGPGKCQNGRSRLLAKLCDLVGRGAVALLEYAGEINIPLREVVSLILHPVWPIRQT